MNVKGKYQTRQKCELLSYLENQPGRHLTAQDVCDGLSELGTPMGLTTVYRQLEVLMAEGLVNKYTLDGKCACFEYVPRDSHLAGECFHCKCERCGKLYHMHCKELETIAEHLAEEHHFRLNPLRTVFYGICEDCQKADGPSPVARRIS